MKHVIVPLTLSTFAVVGCTNCAAKLGKNSDLTPKPDMSRQIRVIGRWSTASACPVGPRLALTAAHVVDPRPFDKTPYSPLTFQQGDVTGTFTVAEAPRVEEGQLVFERESGKPVMDAMVSRSRDLAYVESNVDLVAWYPRAKVPPAPGSQVFFYGMDWRSKKAAFAERIWTAKVIRVVAGMVIYDPPGEPGTSGSCVLNDQGEVVAVNVAGMGVGWRGSVFSDEVGMGVGVWESFGNGKEGN